PAAPPTPGATPTTRSWCPRRTNDPRRPDRLPSRADRPRAERTGHEPRGPGCTTCQAGGARTARPGGPRPAGGPAVHDRSGTGGARPARVGPWSSTWPLDRPPRTGDPGRSGPPTTVPRPPPPAPRRPADDRRGTGRSRRAPAPRPPAHGKDAATGAPPDPKSTR